MRNKYISCYVAAFCAGLLSTACNDFLDEVPDNRTVIDTPEAVSELLVSAYPDANCVFFTESMSDNVTDRGNTLDPYVQPEWNRANRQAFYWEDIDMTYQDSPNYFWMASYQAIAAASSDLGFKYLNTAEALKNTRGYGEGTYFESNGFSTSGARALLEYAKSHACNTMDSRPDTSDIPQRASASAGSNTPVPTSTPTKFTASYEVEDSAKGTLTGNGQTGVSSVEIQADSGTSVNVTAVAAEGFVFYKWSDGVTTATRYDNITKDISVKAMFNDARVELTLDKGDTTIKQGESLTVNAAVKLGNKAYDAANVQWSINDEMEKNGSSLTFKPDAAGTYTIKAGIEINGTFSTAQLIVTVEAEATTINISGTGTLTAGQSTTLTATVENGSGDTLWGCEETSWRTTGTQVTFTANEPGTYHIHAANNGADSVFVLTVSAAATPEPTAAPTPMPEPTPADSTPQ